MLRTILLPTLAAALLAVAAPALALAQGAPPAVGSVPDMTLNDYDGKAHKLADYRGKVVVLDFWATWWAPCEELAVRQLKPLYDDYRFKGLVVIGVGANYNDSIAKQKEAVKKKKLEWVTLFDDGDKVQERWDIQGLPRLILIDREGKVVDNDAEFGTVRRFVMVNCKEIELPERFNSDDEVHAALKARARSGNVSDKDVKDVIVDVAKAALFPVQFSDAAKSALSGDAAKLTLSIRSGKASDQLDAICAAKNLKWAVRDGAVWIDVGDGGVAAPPSSGNGGNEPPPSSGGGDLGKGSPAFEKFMSILKDVVPGSHRALKAESVPDAIAALNARDKTKAEEYFRRFHGAAKDDAEKELLRTLIEQFK